MCITPTQQTPTHTHTHLHKHGRANMDVHMHPYLPDSRSTTSETPALDRW